MFVDLTKTYDTEPIIKLWKVLGKMQILYYNQNIEDYTKDEQ